MSNQQERQSDDLDSLVAESGSCCNDHADEPSSTTRDESPEGRESERTADTAAFVEAQENQAVPSGKRKTREEAAQKGRGRMKKRLRDLDIDGKMSKERGENKR